MLMTMEHSNLLKLKIREIPDWPKKGILFKDITPLLEDPKSFHLVIKDIARTYAAAKITKVVGIDARGFLLAAPVAYELGVGLAIVRKKGKLPGETLDAAYELEYGANSLEIHTTSIVPGENVLIIDDVLATGGTAAATRDLVERLGGTVCGFAFLIELKNLGGRKRLEETQVNALIMYE